MNTYYLTFDEINKEIKDYYKDICTIKSLSNSERHIYITHRKMQLEQCLTQILKLEKSKIENPANLDGGNIDDWDPYYTLMGHFFEGFIKTILMIENFDDFLLNYYNDKTFKDFENAKNELILLLKTKNLTKYQIKRIEEVLKYIQEQRNNFVHFPLKRYYHYDVKYEMYMVIKKLCEQNQIKFSEETIKKLNDAIEWESHYNGGMKFKDVWEH